MILKMFSIYDAKAEAFSQPFFVPTKGLAIRSFTDAANDPKTNIHLYPEDYTLFELGEFDDAKALFVPLSTPNPIGLAIEFKKQGA